MNVIEALRTMRDDMEEKRIGHPYQLVLDQSISQLERAEAEIERALGRTFTPRAAIAIALFHITGKKHDAC